MLYVELLPSKQIALCRKASYMHACMHACADFRTKLLNIRGHSTLAVHGNEEHSVTRPQEMTYLDMHIHTYVYSRHVEYYCACS